MYIQQKLLFFLFTVALFPFLEILFQKNWIINGKLPSLSLFLEIQEGEDLTRLYHVFAQIRKAFKNNLKKYKKKAQYH